MKYNRDALLLIATQLMEDQPLETEVEPAFIDLLFLNLAVWSRPLLGEDWRTFKPEELGMFIWWMAHHAE
jgi:hypothetical protein